MADNIIQFKKNETMIVPDEPVIPYIKGDGIGPEIWDAAQKVVSKCIRYTYNGKKNIQWLEIPGGEKSYKATGEYLPQESIDAIKKYSIAVKGPLATPVGGGIRSLNVHLRQTFDLYANIRPIEYIDFVPSPMKHPEKIKMVIFRENTEDVYSGIEWEAGTKEASEIISFIRKKTGKTLPKDSGIGIKPISEGNSKRLVAKAISYAIEKKLPSVTLMHKGNIMKYTEGAFRKWGYEIAKELFNKKTIIEKDLIEQYQGNCPENKIIIKDRIADMLFQDVLIKPEEYHVIAAPNLNGDYLSDALAAQVGGLGLAPGANLGYENAIFEPVHGTAPSIAGKNLANPGSLILTCAMMLDFIGWVDSAKKIRSAIQHTIKNKTVTQDLAMQMKGAKKLGCKEFADAIIANIK